MEKQLTAIEKRDSNFCDAQRMIYYDLPVLVSKIFHAAFLNCEYGSTLILKDDAHCRNQTAKAFYNSSEWKATRARVLARDTGIDIYLYITEGRVVPADTVHHIVELMEDYSKRCDLDNLISISEATHSMISKAYKDEIKKAQMQQTLEKMRGLRSNVI